MSVLVDVSVFQVQSMRLRDPIYIHMQTQIYWYTLGVVNIHCAWLWLTIMVDYGWLQLCVFVQYTIGYMHGYSLIMVDYG